MLSAIALALGVAAARAAKPAFEAWTQSECEEAYPYDRRN